MAFHRVFHSVCEYVRLFLSAIGRLFEEVKGPIDVVKRKEIIDTLGHATDKADDVAMSWRKLR